MKDRASRGSVVIATKVRGEMWRGKDGEGLSRAHVTRAVEESLRRLDVETIDVYQCHWPDENTPVEETLAVFGELIRAGKVRYVGASNYTSTQLDGALQTARANGLPEFATLQPHHNLVHRSEYEDGLAALCMREGIGVIPYSPLAAGFLTGKYRRGQPLPKSQRAGGVKQYLHERGFAAIAALESVAAVHSATIATVALAWELSRPGIQSPIIGANSTEQLMALLPGSELDLTTDEIASLDTVSAES
jgi:aryl-alcohol dehydrogenase-like predicted oxidoreductase